MNNNRAVVAAVGMGAAVIALSACSSGSSSQSTVTVTATAPARPRRSRRGRSADQVGCAIGDQGPTQRTSTGTGQFATADVHR